MFGSVLGGGQQQQQQQTASSLLSRRQATLERLRTISDAVIAEEVCGLNDEHHVDKC